MFWVDSDFLIQNFSIVVLHLPKLSAAISTGIDGLGMLKEQAQYFQNVERAIFPECFFNFF